MGRERRNREREKERRERRNRERREEKWREREKRKEREEKWRERNNGPVRIMSGLCAAQKVAFLPSRPLSQQGGEIFRNWREKKGKNNANYITG